MRCGEVQEMVQTEGWTLQLIWAGPLVVEGGGSLFSLRYGNVGTVIDFGGMVLSKLVRATLSMDVSPAEGRLIWLCGTYVCADMVQPV